MKLNKHSRRIVLLVLLIVIAITILFQTNPVRAIVSGTHAFMVMVRVQTEIMQKIPAGRYYESLLWKHNDELMRIYSENPEQVVVMRETTLMFIPGLEALLDGKGGTVVITSEQIKSLEEHLDWLAGIGSISLRKDIEKEKQRFQLSHFIGMTMNEALDYINETWSPDTEVVKNIVPDSNGEWAYYIHQGIYLEYPNQYYVQESESRDDYIYFVPATDMPEQWHPFVTKMKVWIVPENENPDVYSWYSHDNLLWEIPIQLTDFQGYQFIREKSPTFNMHAFLYNKDKQLAIEIWLFIYESLPKDEEIDYLQLVNERYAYFQHMVNSIKIYIP